jgi:NAD(P)-dependent dehydrogenase (short-subunit alcohol dehydrogenase family)
VAAYEPFVVSVMREDDPSGSSKPEETQMDRTVAVTGGSKLGRAVVAALIEEGWTAVNSDRVPSPDSQPTSYARTSPTTARARGHQDCC